MSKIQRLREQLYLLQGSRCFYCDKPIPGDERTLEHVIPCSDGGAADADNGVVVCEAANQLLGSVTPKQKMIMLKAGAGRIECPKKCIPTVASEKNDRFRYNELEACPKVVDSKESAGGDDAVKRKNRNQHAKQTLPRPAAGPRRR